MERFLRCPKINRIIIYGQYCVFECPNRDDVIAGPGLGRVEVKCSVDDKEYSMVAVNGDDEEKLAGL